MLIAIIGVGLQSHVAAALFASVGNQVVIFENESTIQLDLNEPSLHHLFQEQIESGRLVHLDANKEASGIFDFVLLSGVFFEEISAGQKNYLLSLINSNTKFIILTPSNVGEAHQLSLVLNSSNRNVSVSSVPLLVREGIAINDFSRPKIIVIGCDHRSRLSEIVNLFYPFNRVKNVIKVVSSKEAEFSSFAGNAMLATRLSFMNEMASLAEKNDVDIDVVRECIGRDPRIGHEYLYPGCGYGGKSLVENVSKVAKGLSSRIDDLGLLETVSKINERQKDLLFRKIWRFFNAEIKNKTIAIWGASFKPGSSSIEGAPAVTLMESLLAHSTNIRIYDPLALPSLKTYFGNTPRIVYAKTSKEALLGADVLAICTEWKEFWNPDFQTLKTTLGYRAIFDGRNLYNPQLLEEYGLTYFGIGKGKII